MKGTPYVVDATTGCWEWTRGKTSDGYGACGFRGKSALAHRVTWIKTYGEVPEGMCVEHRCRNRSCVNPVHLRLATHSQNHQNRAPWGNYNTRSRYRGVSYLKHSGKWAARAILNGRVYYLGCYTDENEAGRVVTEWRRENMPFSETDRAVA